MAKSNKLDASEKLDYSILLENFKDADKGLVIPFRMFGLTVAIRPASYGRNTRFFKVSIAYCSAGDKFSRKRGIFEAMLKNMNEEFMLVPSYGQDAETIAQKIAEFMQ